MGTIVNTSKVIAWYQISLKMGDTMKEDTRFKHIARDPRFRKMKRKDRKVKIDKRFHGMFNDKNFKLKYTVDKRGRPVNTSTNENLQRYYDVSSSEEEEEEEASDKDVAEQNDKEIDKKNSLNCEEQQQKVKVKKKHKQTNIDESSDDEVVKVQKKEETSNIKDDIEDSEDDSDSEADLARGVGNVETSSSEDNDDENEKTEDLDHAWGELAKDAPVAAEATSRLALCNMDWDRIKAADILVLLSSFLLPGSSIESVKIYPSEYGKERMAEEDMKGPKELVESSKKRETDGEVAQREHLRQYQ